MEWLWIGAAVSVAATLALAPLLARRLVPRDLPAGEVQRRQLQLDVVRVCAEVLGGALLLVALIVGWQQLTNTQEQLAIARQGQVTERFTRAIDQLGSSETAVRVGGIYALESIARDSATDRRAVLEVLASFLRERSPVTGDTGLRDWRQARSDLAAPDVAAAALAIGRRDRSAEPVTGAGCDALGGENFPCVLSLRNVDLSRIQLSGLDFGQMDLRGAAFNFSNLPFASVRGSDLQGADLRGANLRLADMTGASLRGAWLGSTNLHLAEGLTCEQLRSARDEGAGAANLTLDCP